MVRQLLKNTLVDNKVTHHKFIIPLTSHLYDRKVQIRLILRRLFGELRATFIGKLKKSDRNPNDVRTVKKNDVRTVSTPLTYVVNPLP